MVGGWSIPEFGCCAVPDQRFIPNLCETADRLYENPGVSFSGACGPGLRQSGHRLFSDEDTTVDGLLSGHIGQTLERARERGLKRIVVAQDTTVLDYGTHRATRGLGPVNDQSGGLGLFVHSALAMTDRGLPLGVVDASIWARDPAKRGTARLRRTRPIESKESYRWLQTAKSIEERFEPFLNDGGQVIIVQDREADIFELLAAPRHANVGLVIRASHPRAVMDGEDHSHLFDAVRASPLLSTYEVAVTTPQHVARRAKMELRARRLEVLPPRRAGKSLAAQLVYVVEASEVDAPAGAEALNWTLLSTAPVNDDVQARDVIDLYTRRWAIERLHFTLKSGCQIERLQMDDFHTLSNALAVYYVVAWRIMFMTHVLRQEPDTPSDALVEPATLSVLSRKLKTEVKTARDLIVAIARLGGYSPYKGGPPPGLKVLWIGWRRLSAMSEGWQLALNDK